MPNEVNPIIPKTTIMIFITIASTGLRREMEGKLIYFFSYLVSFELKAVKDTELAQATY